MTITERFKSLSDKIFDSYNNLSEREKLGAIVAALAIVFVVCYSAYNEINRTFDRQKRKLASLTREVGQIEDKLARYTNLKARLNGIEAQFEQIKFSGGVRSYLEKLIQDKGQVQSGQYKIKPQHVRKLSNDYKLEPYGIEFTTTNLANLVELLRELIYGKKPLLVTKLDVKKKRRSGKLSVTLDVSSIKNVD